MARLKIDAEEVRTYVLSNPQADYYDLSSKYRVAPSTMLYFLKRIGFVRIRTSGGVRWIEEKTLPLNLEYMKPKEEGKQLALDNSDEDVNLMRARMEVDSTLSTVAHEIEEWEKNRAKQGEIVLCIATSPTLYAKILSARLQGARRLENKKPMREWSRAECARYATTENWLKFLLDSILVEPSSKTRIP